jgi:annexin A7/11
MAGIGTDNEMLIRVAIRSREPMLMQQIKQEYQILYRKTLVDRVKGEASGNYERLLVQILGK